MNEGRIKFEEYFTNLELVLHISASSYIFERDLQMTNEQRPLWSRSQQYHH